MPHNDVSLIFFSEVERLEYLRYRVTCGNIDELGTVPEKPGPRAHERLSAAIFSGSFFINNKYIFIAWLIQGAGVPLGSELFRTAVLNNI